jgi:CRISPR-associated protein Csd1
MGIVYYRDLFASEYLNTIERWHSEFAWPQRVVKDIEDASTKKNKQKVVWSPFAPSPYSILNTAYGDIIKSSDTLKKSLYERLIPCIVEGVSFPKDLVDLAVRRASNPSASEKWEWEKNIGVACSLYRGFYNRHPIIQKRRNYSMSLEAENRSRDYLYGRLLAIAERIEEVALNVAGENRPTTAARLMQRFADRPFSTWRNLELALLPYMQRLQSSRTGFLVNQKKELDDVLSLFNTQDFTTDKALSGEFLLGYHCQRQTFRNKTESDIEQA